MIRCPPAPFALGNQATCSPPERTLVGGIGKVAVTVMPLSSESNSRVSRQLAEAFLQSTKTNSSRRLQVQWFVSGDPSARVSDFNQQSAFITNDPDPARHAARVPMNLGQTLLNRAKDCNLPLAGAFCQPCSLSISSTSPFRMPYMRSCRLTVASL